LLSAPPFRRAGAAYSIDETRAAAIDGNAFAG
jgi:hypothetical protein